MAIGTAHMASLCLENSELHTGIAWQDSAVLERAVSDPSRPAALLYPGEGAFDVVKDPPKGPITLIVVDGTWWQAKKLVQKNPLLANLPRYAFTPEAPSEYRIRREPRESYVSTIEALSLVLGALEGDPERFRAMLVPFRKMIDTQIEHTEKFRDRGSRHKKKLPGVKRVVIPEVLRERPRDVVCVVGEANAWPYRDERGSPEHPDELIHWVAHRISTGERFDEIVSPTHPLAPNTASYVELTPGAIARGVPLRDALERWRAFVRDTDVLCSWGHYGTALLASSGGFVPETRVDLRQAARMFSRGRVGTVEDFITRLVPMPEIETGPQIRGRGGMRLAQIVAVARRLVDAGATMPAES